MENKKMDENEIYKTIKKILSDDLKLDIDIEKEIKKGTMLIGGGYLDSLDLMAYITHIEETYKIKVSDEAIKEHQLGIVQNMINYVISKSGK